MTADPTCSRCGGPLKVVRVKVPVRSADGATVRYEEREEIADCPRCTGGY